VLCTLHRAENTDDLSRLTEIIDSLNIINKEKEVVLPIHPRTRKIIEQNNLKVEFTVIPPVGYFDMIELLKNCSLVMTDSGGLQKEAFFFGKFCITMRDQTEWVELVENGFNIITGASKSKILNAYKDSINKSANFSIDLYGGGKAAQNIVKALKTL